MSSPWPLAGESTAALAALPAPLKRHFHWEDDLFVHGNEERERGSKTFKYTVEGGSHPADGGNGGVCFDDDAAQQETCEFVCGVEGCPVVLRSLSAYDAHYQHWHTFKCEVCGLQLPNNRLLEMHLAERHDELFRCMAKTRKMYQCLVEGCPQKSNTRKGRQLHLVAKHAYPPNYTYDRRIRRAPAKSTRARHKEKPQRIDSEMSDSTFTTIGASRSPEALLSQQAAGASAGALTGVAPATATPAPRPAVVSRSTILSFMPRSVRSAGVAAAATAGGTGAAKNALSAQAAQPLPSYDSTLASCTAASRDPATLPAADPAHTGSLFTSMRDRRDSDHDHGMRDDDDGNDAGADAGLAKGLVREDDDADEDDAERKEGAGEDGSGMDDVDAAVGVSRLRVSQSLPKKCSFGSMNRRHK